MESVTVAWERWLEMVLTGLRRLRTGVASAGFVLLLCVSPLSWVAVGGKLCVGRFSRCGVLLSWRAWLGGGCVWCDRLVDRVLH